jgi:hypothetical protein
MILTRRCGYQAAILLTAQGCKRMTREEIIAKLRKTAPALRGKGVTACHFRLARPIKPPA